MSIKSAICYVLIFVLILSVFTLSAFADSPDPSADSDAFYLLPDTEITLGQMTNHMYYGYAVSGEIYACWLTANPAAGRQYMGPCFLSREPATAYIRRDNSPSGNSTLTLDQTTGVYMSAPYGEATYNGSLVSTILPQFTDAASAAQAFAEWDPDASPPTVSSFQYSLPPGNVAYIEMSSQSTSAVSLFMQSPVKSNVFGADFKDANSTYELTNSLPTVGSQTAGTLIPWVRSGKTDLLGRTYDATFGPIGPIATTYLAIVNPAYYDKELLGDPVENPNIVITAINVVGITVYPLEASIVFNGSNNGIGVNSTIIGDPYVGDVDEDTGLVSWTDPDGGTSAPPIGGNNLIASGESFMDVIRNIATQISSFLDAPASAIRTVVNSIRDFLASFTELYTWLPSPVYNLITSALIIALTIGVIKIFV